MLCRQWALKCQLIGTASSNRLARLKGADANRACLAEFPVFNAQNREKIGTLPAA
jgi:hypothetical protein